LLHTGGGTAVTTKRCETDSRSGLIRIRTELMESVLVVVPAAREGF
jgi:hypothetical protein